MKPALLRPQAQHDLRVEVGHYRKEAGAKVAVRLVKASNAALDRIEFDPAIGSPVLGKTLGLASLRTWRLAKSHCFGSTWKVETTSTRSGFWVNARTLPQS